LPIHGEYNPQNLLQYAIDDAGNKIPFIQPLIKKTLHNVSVSSNSNIFGSDADVSYPPAVMRIYFACSGDGPLTVKRTNLGVTVSELLNGGFNLLANCGYLFDILVVSGDTINLQTGATAPTILKCIVLEVPKAGI